MVLGVCKKKKKAIMGHLEAKSVYYCSALYVELVSNAVAAAFEGKIQPHLHINL